MGSLEMVTATVRCAWVITTNNAELDADAASRCIFIRLDTGEETPEARCFKRSPIEEISQQRGEACGAILTLVRAWLEAGRPPYSGLHRTRFSAWQQVIGGILQTVGIEGFLDNLEAGREALNPERAAWRALTELWHEKHGERFVGAADLLPLALEIPEIAVLLGEKEGRPQTHKLGKYLSHRRDKVFNGLKIRAGIAGRNGQTYRVCDDSGDGGDHQGNAREAQSAPIHENEFLKNCRCAHPKSPQTSITAITAEDASEEAVDDEETI